MRNEEQDPRAPLLRRQSPTPQSQSDSYELDAEGFEVVADVLVQEAVVHPMHHRFARAFGSTEPLSARGGGRKVAPERRLPCQRKARFP